MTEDVPHYPTEITYMWVDEFSELTDEQVEMLIRLSGVLNTKGELLDD